MAFWWKKIHQITCQKLKVFFTLLTCSRCTRGYLSQVWVLNRRDLNISALFTETLRTDQIRNIRTSRFCRSVSISNFSFYRLLQDPEIVIPNQHVHMNENQIICNNLYIILISTNRSFKKRDEVWFVFAQGHFKVMYGARFSFADRSIHHIPQSSEWGPHPSTWHWTKKKTSFKWKQKSKG